MTCLTKILLLIGVVVVVVVVVVVDAQVDYLEFEYHDENFNQWRFRSKVNDAIQSVQTILNHTRHPQLAEHEPHSYHDKYVLAEFLTNTAVASYLNAFEALVGWDRTTGLLDNLLQAHQKGDSVRLRFEPSVTCDFLKEQEVQVEEQQVEVQETGGLLGLSTRKVKVSKTIKEFQWLVGLSYNVTVLSGKNDNRQMDLLHRNTSTTILTRVASAPFPQVQHYGPTDLRLSWMLDQIHSETYSCNFSIDRRDESCRTPRRNRDVEQAIRFNRELFGFSSQVFRFFADTVERQLLGAHQGSDPTSAPHQTRRQLRQVSTQNLFHPIVPLMDNATVLLQDVDALLAEQIQTLQAERLRLELEFAVGSSSGGALIGAEEAMMVLVSRHWMELAQQHTDAINYIEQMLESQLVEAIGRHLTEKDLDEFMRFHNKRFFKQDFRPEPFARAIRQPDHYPDGILSIETSDGEIVDTLVRHTPGNRSAPLSIPINAATNVQMSGDRYLHGWMQHWFWSSPTQLTRIAARARQFSSFLLLLGTMSGPQELSVSHAIILRNRDEVLIPLLSEVLPSAKAFRDSIVSLSPEQQAFAKALRGMQLQRSVFGICVIQLKPQLERLLALPSGALTKEIQLTENIVSLFVDYQIPPDLLSYAGDESADTAFKLGAVIGHVSKVMEMIDAKKKEQLEEETRKADMRHEKTRRGGGPSHGPSASPSGTGERFQTFAASSVKRDLRGGSQESLFSTNEAMPDKVEQFVRGMGDGPTERVMHKKLDSDHPPSEEQPLSEVVPSLESDDVTLIPKILDLALEQHDSEGNLRSAILRVDVPWTLHRQDSLLSPLSVSTLDGQSGQISVEKKRALDLLDAISRSGTLPIDSAELHVIVGVAHCFEGSLLDSVIRDNINPIEKIEKSLVLLAKHIHRQDGTSLFDNLATLKRLSDAYPELFNESPSNSMSTS